MKQLFTLSAGWALFLLVCWSMASCTVSTPSFSTASAGQELAYLAKPVFQDSAVSATYISGALNLGSFYQIEDKNASGEFSLHRSHTFKYLNLAYGGHGFLGSYRVTDMGSFEGKKAYHGYGFRASANVNIPYKNSNWRIIGVDGAITRELGAYQSFRKEAATDGQLYDLHSADYYSVVGLRSEFIKKMQRIQNVRWGLSVGYFWILQEPSRMVLFAPYLEYKRLGISMFVTGGNNAGSTVFRLNYRL